MVIIIRGAPSVGKSTMARLLADRLDQCALLELDLTLPRIAEPTKSALNEQGRAQGSSFWNDCLISQLDVLEQHELDVIVDGFFPVAWEFGDLMTRLRDRKVPIGVFLLTVDPAEHLSRDRTRPAEWQLGSPGVAHFAKYSEFGRIPHGNIIDTTGLAPHEIVTAILASIELSSG